MAFCAKCGAQLAEGSGFCSGCGTAVGAQPGAPATGVAAAPAGTATSGLTNNVAGALCYILGIITGVIFLVIDPYKNSRFVRFHAFQSILFWAACFGFWVIWSWVLVGMVFSVLGWGLLSLLGTVFLVVRLAMLAAWLFLMYKAYNNEEFKLPIIGDIAAKQAGV